MIGVLGSGRGARQLPGLPLEAAIRLVGLLALSVPALWSRDSISVLGLITLALVWLGVTLGSALPVSPRAQGIIEGCLVGLVAGLTTTGSGTTLLGAIVLPPLTMGLRVGLASALYTLAACLSVSVASTWAFTGLDAELGAAILSWSVTSLGAAMIASALHSDGAAEPDPLLPYREARTLLGDLLDLSQGLSSGLNPEFLAAEGDAAIRDRLPVSRLLILVRREGALIPLSPDQPELDEDSALLALAERSLSDGALLSDRHFAIPLSTDSVTVGAAVGELGPGLSLDPPTVQAALDDLAVQLEGTAIRLDTALMFLAFRDAATVDERRRLAREMHDGVAQDIASLGYLVDALSLGAATDEQRSQLEDLRARITAIVAEVRRSVLKLRTQADANESLGAAISSQARHLSQISGVPIQVSVNERTTRLRPAVEAELLRIAQEAMNNAVRHAEPSVITVSCEVSPPSACLVVTDDGPGLRGPRLDSHGLRIMDERARLIGADLHIGDAPEGGVQVTVTLGLPAGRSDSPAPDHGKVTP